MALRFPFESIFSSASSESDTDSRKTGSRRKRHEARSRQQRQRRQRATTRDHTERSPQPKPRNHRPAEIAPSVRNVKPSPTLPNPSKTADKPRKNVISLVSPISLSTNQQSSPSKRQRRQREEVVRERSLSRHQPTPLKRRRSSQKLATATALEKSPVPPAKPATQTSKKRRSRSRRTHPIIYGARLLILGVGIGVIAGTLLSVGDPANRYSTQQAAVIHSQPKSLASATPTITSSLFASAQLGQEIAALKSKVQTLAAQMPNLKPGVFLVDLDSGSYVDLDGAMTLPAASTIKVPVLVAFFQDVDAGKIRLDEQMTMNQSHIAEGSGEMQYQAVGTTYTALEVATKMITISDNTATNMLIERLGGADVLNQRFRTWGLNSTTIRNPLPDLEGTNTTSAKDLVNLLALINQGDLVTMRSRDRLLEIMRGTVTNTLLPAGLGEGATIAHKTGDIGALLADAGLVDLPTGKRYLISVMVQRPHNDYQAGELIRQISQAVYEHFNQPAPTPTAAVTTSAEPSPTVNETAPTAANPDE